MKKILFPTDFSDTANNAFVYTLHFAKSYNAEIIVLHTFDEFVISSLHAGNPDAVHNVYTNMELSEFEHFKEQGLKLRSIAEQEHLENLKISFVFEADNLVSTIKKIVEKEAIGLVVMGTNGASGWGKKIWGTNTMKAMESLNIPILSIPKMANFKVVKNIGFTTLFNDIDKDYLKTFLTAAKYFNGMIKVLHIIESSGNIPKKEAFATEKINEWTSEFDSNRVEFIVKRADTAKKGVVEFINSQDIDLLIIEKRNLSFIDQLIYSSLSEKLIAELKIPLLVLKK